VLSFRVTLSRLHTEQEASQTSALLSNVSNTVAYNRMTSRNYDYGRVGGEAEQRGMFSFCVSRHGKFMWSEYYLQNITKPRAPYRHIRLLFNHIHSLLSQVLCVLN